MEYYVEPTVLSRETSGILSFQEFGHHSDMERYFHDAIKIAHTPKVSVAIMSHRNLDVFKLCVECVLKYLGDIDYELVLLDNASDDGDATYQYMQSIPYKRKRIIKVCDNMGPHFNAARAWTILYKACRGDFIYHMNDDHIITENSFQNLLRAIESDPTIGMVFPKSSNARMYQNPGLVYRNYEEMHEAARKFNRYDPRKWEERLYVAEVTCLFRRELMHCFEHVNPFGPEMCRSFAMRAAGYRTMLLGDTWVHHEHDYSSKKTYGFIGEGADKEKERQLIKQWTSHLYYGLSFEEDICTFEFDLVSMLKPRAASVSAAPSLLSVDVKAGQGLLDLKNRLRTFGIFDTQSTAFSTHARYYPVLYTIANEVFVDRIAYIEEALEDRRFDYIIMGTPINLYSEPIRLLTTVLQKLNPSGEMLFKLRNTASLTGLVKMLGMTDAIDGDMPAMITEYDIARCLQVAGYTDIRVTSIPYRVDEKGQQLMRDVLSANGAAKNSNLLQALATRDFHFAVSKPV